MKGKILTDVRAIAHYNDIGLSNRPMSA
jgi:hypothetical protein